MYRMRKRDTLDHKGIYACDLSPLKFDGSSLRHTLIVRDASSRVSIICRKKKGKKQRLFARGVRRRDPEKIVTASLRIARHMVLTRWLLQRVFSK